MDENTPLRKLPWRLHDATNELTGEDQLTSENDRQSDDDEEMMDDGEEEVGSSEVDVGVLIEAMTKCVAFYHQANKSEFYAMVAEEYGTLLPDCEEIAVDTIERREQRFQRIVSQWSSRGSDDVFIPREVIPHVRALRAFYETIDIGRVDAEEANDDDEREGTGSYFDFTHSPGGQTDCSGSNPTTPQNNRPRESRDEHEDQADSPEEVLPPPSSEVTAATAVRTTSLTDPRSSQITYRHATSTISELTKTHAESKQRLRDAEELLKTEKARTQQRKREYKELKSILKQYRQRDEERRRVRMLFEGDNGRGSDDSDSESHRMSIRELRKLYRKETKRSKRLQETLSLKFQLLQSEYQHYKMKTEQLMTELRNEYTDSFVFGP